MKRVVGALLARLRPSVDGASFQSFAAWLPRLLELLPPQRVLEFGPGTSTRLVLAHSRAQIVSVETSRPWFRRYQREFGDDPRVDLRLRDVGWDMEALAEDVGRGFDLVFVDGGARQEALFESRSLVSPGGVVVVHDAHRDDYYWAMSRYRYLFPPERHSCIVTDDADAFRTVVRGIEPDHDTHSVYTRKPYRRAYFDDLVARSRRDQRDVGLLPEGDDAHDSASCSRSTPVG